MTVLRLIISMFLFAALLQSCEQTKTNNNRRIMNVKDYFDSTGNVIIKLYKKEGDKMLYWETWNVDDKTATIHWGQLGTLGEDKDVHASSFQELKDKLNSFISDKQNEGYQEIPLDRQYTVAIKFKLKSWGTPDDLYKREDIRNILTDHLGWTGNGRCDDGDIGSGEMTLFADVVDPYLAIKTIPQELKKQNVTEDYYFTITQGDSTIANKIKPD